MIDAYMYMCRSQSMDINSLYFSIFYFYPVELVFVMSSDYTPLAYKVSHCLSLHKLDC